MVRLDAQDCSEGFHGQARSIRLPTNFTKLLHYFRLSAKKTNFEMSRGCWERVRVMYNANRVSERKVHRLCQIA